MEKRILIHLPKNPGGKQNYFLAIKDHLESEVEFFFCGSQGRQESKWAKAKRLMQDYRSFYRQVKRGQYDLVHINPTLNPKSFFRDSLFTWVSWWVGVKTVVFWHGWRKSFEQKVARKWKPYFRWTYGKADAMIFLAQDFSDTAASFGYQKKRYLETTVIEEGILQYQNGKGPARAAHNDGNPLVILFLSRIEKAKGIYELLDSFQVLRKKYPKLVLHIAGEGNERRAAESLVQEKGIEGVRFLGWVQGKEKAAAFHQADLYVLPSYTEGMPISLLEAMASGLPVVTTNVGGIRDFFDVQKMGFIVHPKDSTDLREKLEQLVRQPELMDRFGAFNAIYARDRYAPQQVSKRLEAIYAAVLVN